VRAALRCVLCAVAVLAACLVGPAAQAHPLGDPQTLTLSLDAPDEVRAVWRVGSQDDLTWLADDIGLLPPERVMLDGALVSEPGDADLLTASPRFDEYLLAHVRVGVGGAACAGRLTDKRDLWRDGAALLFTCPSPVTTARVEASVLTDLEAAYRTVATGPGGQTFTYDGSATAHDWTFDPAAAPAAAAPGAGGRHGGAVVTRALLAVGIALPALVGGLVGRQARRRRRTPDGGAPGSPDAHPAAAAAPITRADARGEQQHPTATTRVKEML
jgi:hypothetical protein